MSNMDGFEQMWDTDDYDECPAADVAEVCERIRRFLTRRRFQLSLQPQKLHRSILEYIWMRYTTLPQHISYPKRKQEAPLGWTVEKERVWRQHIFRVCDWDAWIREVMHPVFGTDERLWEAPISKDWRMEILEFLPWWIYRDADLFEEVDPTPLPEPEEIAAAEAAARKKEIDPYILDHGGRRARRQAEKEGGPVSG
jgi:hypothetical protein